MPEPAPVHEVPAALPRRDKLPPETGPPSGYQRPTNGWDALSEGVRAGERLYERHQERASEQPTRQPRPPASTTAIVALVIAIAAPIGLATWHQLGANDYKQDAATRHEALMNELRAQRAAIYGLTDVVADHHPEAAKVGTKLSRDVAHGSVPAP